MINKDIIKMIYKSPELIPSVFEFSYGPCLILNSFSVKVKDGKIIPSSDFLLFPNFDNEYIIPTKEEWDRFWKKMDKIGIWNWMEYYYPQETMVLDGVNWNLKIEVGKRKIECSGSNAYPGEEIGDIIDVDKSRPFEKFLYAFERLTGLRIKDMRLRDLNKQS